MDRVALKGPARITAQAWAVFALLLLPLQVFGCSRDSRDGDMRQCIAQAEKAAMQGAPPGEGGEEQHDRIGAEVAACMEQRGYRHDNGSMADAQCVDDVDYNAHCYARRD